MFDGLDHEAIRSALNAIDIGLPDGNRYTDAPNAEERAAWRVVQRQSFCGGKSEAMCQRIIKAWLESGLLVKRTYENPKTRKEVVGLWVDNSKRPG